MLDTVQSTKPWRQPTIKEIAEVAKVGTATVDRVLNGRTGVREATRKKVFAAIELLSKEPQTPELSQQHKIVFICESGIEFNQSLENAVNHSQSMSAFSDFQCTFIAIETRDVDPVRFAQLIERTATDISGLIIVAREDLTINRAIKSVATRGVSVVCITTDLPNSKRLAYVGSDQVSAGATAAYLMGQSTAERSGQILLVSSAPYRCQEERELGFRRVLRSEFSHLDVVERVHSNDDTEHTYQGLRKYLAEHDAPIGIYNVAGGNPGISRALEEANLKGKVVFIGHELNTSSRMLLETDAMDFVISHDIEQEVAQSIQIIHAHLEQREPPEISPGRVLVFTKYNCN